MNHRSARLPLAALAAATLLVPSPACPAQSGSRGAMVIDDGVSRHVLHYSEPDVEAAVRPGVTRAELGLIDDTLLLSEAQREAVGHLVDDYLESFAALCAERHPRPGEGDAAADGRGGDAPPGAAAGPDEGDNERDVMRTIILEELQAAGIEASSWDDMPVSPRVAIGIGIEDDGSGAGPQPSVNVSLSFGGEDDSMTEEMRGKLQAAADRIVPRLTEHVRKSQEMRRERQDAEASPAEEIGRKWDEIRQLRARIRAFRKEAAALDRRFATDTKTLLAEEQLERWPALERALTRRRTLPLGRLDGESTDLLALVDDLELSDAARAGLADILGAYEQQLHEALVRRNELLEEADAEIDLALYEQRFDRARSVADRVTRARTAVRALNDRTALAIEAALPAPQAGAFRAEALAAAHPRIHRTTLARQAFAAAAALEGLDADVRSSMEELRTAYDDQLRPINERLERTIRREQTGELRRQVERAVASIEDREIPDDADAGRDAILGDFRARQQLDLRTMRTLYRMLPPERIAELPKMPVADVADPVTSEHVEREG
jgi:hypothetical protein